MEELPAPRNHTIPQTHSPPLLSQIPPSQSQPLPQLEQISQVPRPLELVQATSIPPIPGHGSPLVLSSPAWDRAQLELLQKHLLGLFASELGFHWIPLSSLSLNCQLLQFEQLVSVKDIYQSNIDVSISNSQWKYRLLRFGFTDGCSQVIAIEYLPIPAISEETAPGTKCMYQSSMSVVSSMVSSEIRRGKYLVMSSMTLEQLSRRMQITIYDDFNVSPVEPMQEVKPSHTMRSYSQREKTNGKDSGIASQ
ncbi:hypothetical protein MRB53_021129 [Persea americana]|uniref:Uncharacterized protein n=1 Tax=Persea americana TaxID=3435 RepID=A0ACC2L2V7_PERAE|nr:hypothetical protein MRB53_021129 [Persea americana]